jgi:hypothetical protein
MSKILITENRLRNILFKTFLKNPKILKEQEENGGEIEKAVSDILSDVSKQSMSDTYEKELMLLTIRREWATSAYNLLRIDPGASIFDHLLGTNIPEALKQKWEYASETEGLLRSQDLIDIMQLSTAFMPYDAFGVVVKNPTESGFFRSLVSSPIRFIDLSTTAVTGINNFLFALHLANLNEEGAEKQINATGQTRKIKKGSLRTDANWYYVYAACDLISFLTAGWFHVDANLINGKFRKVTAEGQNKATTFVHTDKNGNIVERVVNTTTGKDEIPEELKDAAKTGTNKKVSDLTNFNSQPSEVIRNIVNDVNQEATETFAITTKLLPDEDDPYLKKIIEIEKSIDAEPVIFKNDLTQAEFDALEPHIKSKYDDNKSQKLPEKVNIDEYNQLSAEAQSKYGKHKFKDGERYYELGTDIKNTQNSIPDYSLKNDIAKEQSNALETYEQQKAQGQLDINDPKAMVKKNKEELKKAIEEIKETATKKTEATTVAYDIIVDKEIKNSSNIFDIKQIKTSDVQIREIIAEITQDQFEKFLSTLQEFTGIDETQFFKEINAFLKNQELIGGNDNLINKQNFVKIYNKLMSKEGAAPIKTSLFKKLQDYSALIQGKSRLRKIENIEQVFPTALKNKYLEKLLEINQKIKNLGIDDTALTDLFRALKENPKLSNDEIEFLIKKINLSSDQKDKLFILIKGRQNNVKELLNLSLDRKIFEKSSKGLNNQEIFYKDFDNYFDINVQSNKMQDVYDVLIELNFVDEYLYRRRLSRYHKSINSNLTSKIDSILSLIDVTNQSSFAKNNEELAKAFEKYNINKAIDGTLGVATASQKQQINDICQWFRLLKRYMDRYEATCDVINDTDSIKEVDYIYNLIDKNIIAFAGASGASGKSLFDLLKIETVEQLNDLKNNPEKLKKLIRERGVNKEFLETLNTGLLSNFVEVDRINVKIPQLISTQYVEDMYTASSKFQLNYSMFQNLVSAIEDLDEALPQIININRILIGELQAQKAALLNKVSAGVNVEVEKNLIELQIEFLENFNEGLRKFINNARENSGLGTAGLNFLDTKLIPDVLNHDPKQFETINIAIKILKSEEGNNALQKTSRMGAFIQWCASFFTKFKDRKVKNVSAKVFGASIDNEKEEKKFLDKFNRVFELLKQKNGGEESAWLSVILNLAGMPSSKKAASFLPGINVAMGLLSAIKQITFMNVILGASQAAILAAGFGFFVKGYLLGAGLHLVIKLFTHSLPEFKQLGIGISTSIIKSLSVIGKQLSRIVTICRRDVNNEIANILNDDVNYMKRLEELSDIEDDELQNSFLDKSISDEIIDIITPTAFENSIKKSYGQGTLFRDLDLLYEQYKSLPNSLIEWRSKMGIINPGNDDEWNKAEVEDRNAYYDTIIGKIDKLFYEKILGNNPEEKISSNWKNLSPNNKQLLKEENPKTNEFLKAIIVLNILNELNMPNQIQKSDAILMNKLQLSGDDATEIIEKLISMSRLRNELKNKIELLRDSVKIFGAADFNIDSLITGGYHSVIVNDLTIKFSYSKRYKYQKDNSNIKIPHFQQKTKLPNSNVEVNNMALEIYSYQKMKDTQGIFLNPANIVQTSLMPIEATIDIINMAILSYNNVVQGLPANAR